MRRRGWTVVFGAAVALSGWTAAGAAEEKKPAAFEYGFYERARYEYFRNSTDLDYQGAQGNTSYMRFKTSVWGRWNITDSVNLYGKVTNESRYFFAPAAANKGHYFNSNEGLVDNLYIEAKNAFGLPLDLKIGRQDFLGRYGDMFLVADGTPGDGSRTFYFNAAAATWKINPRNTLDFVYISNPRTDIYLPLVNDLNTGVNVSDEQAIMLYAKSRINDRLAIEPYYIHKSEEANGGNPKLQLETLGARAVVTADPWRFRGEFATQFGDYEGVAYDREGNGGYIMANRVFKGAKLKPDVGLAFFYLSGDDTSTPDLEHWDPLFSRYPWISEFYYVTMAAEKGVAYWTNLSAWQASVKLTLSQATNLTIWYNYLRANENVAGAFFGTGKDRGHLPQIRVNHRFNKYLDGYVLYEYFIPGDFHSAAAQDTGMFLRAELQLKF